jgi:xanthine dehydrogenase accessory factor
MADFTGSLYILIRGANDVGSAVAHVLFTAGYSVILHETSQPVTARRKMSFTDAVFDGCAELENVTAELVDDDSRLLQVLADHQVIPFSTKDISTLIETLHPHILIDARMRKHTQPESQRGLAALTIGLGPNFSAGETVDAAIETAWGESMGRVVWRGTTNPMSGEPREIGGHARDRYVYAPGAGIFHTIYQVGDKVKSGDVLAFIDSTPLPAPITGVLRGITRDGVTVSQKAKVIEVDPRETGAQVSGIGERPARIARGVLQAVQVWMEEHSL